MTFFQFLISISLWTSVIFVFPNAKGISLFLITYKLRAMSLPPSFDITGPASLEEWDIFSKYLVGTVVIGIKILTNWHTIGFLCFKHTFKGMLSPERWGLINYDLNHTSTEMLLLTNWLCNRVAFPTQY